MGCASTPTPTPSAPALAGTAWTVTSVGGTDTLAAARPTMAFGVDGRIQGSGSCNGYGGPYRLDGDVIEIGELASTLMLCQDAAIGVQETAFMGALRGAQVWSIDDGGELHLGGVSEIVARPVGAEPSASGAGGIVGAWDLVELGRTADFAHLVPTIEFTADGSVSGFAACNTFRGTYTTDGSTLSVGPLATTKMACERPASAVEAEYLTALDAVTGWAIESDGRLRLEGPIQLRFAHH
ncbi:MAG TPA: META domain-containing protein [Candidatus Limnocylindrales bacterium]|nr:META domain-containing protein [Candidatus Limnocylindrales bacterium]